MLPRHGACVSTTAEPVKPFTEATYSTFYDKMGTMVNEPNNSRNGPDSNSRCAAPPDSNSRCAAPPDIQILLSLLKNLDLSDLSKIFQLVEQSQTDTKLEGDFFDNLSTQEKNLFAAHSFPDENAGLNNNRDQQLRCEDKGSLCQTPTKEQFLSIDGYHTYPHSLSGSIIENEDQVFQGVLESVASQTPQVENVLLNTTSTEWPYKQQPHVLDPGEHNNAFRTSLEILERKMREDCQFSTDLTNRDSRVRSIDVASLSQVCRLNPHRYNNNIGYRSKANDQVTDNQQLQRMGHQQRQQILSSHPQFACDRIASYELHPRSNIIRYSGRPSVVLEGDVLESVDQLKFKTCTNDVGNLIQDDSLGGVTELTLVSRKSDDLDVLYKIEWQIGSVSKIPLKLSPKEGIVSPQFTTNTQLKDVWIMLTLIKQFSYSPKSSTQGTKTVAQSQVEYLNLKSAFDATQENCSKSEPSLNFSFGISFTITSKALIKFGLRVGNVRKGPFVHYFGGSPWSPTIEIGIMQDVMQSTDQQICLVVEVYDVMFPSPTSEQARARSVSLSVASSPNQMSNPCKVLNNKNYSRKGGILGGKINQLKQNRQQQTLELCSNFSQNKGNTRVSEKLV